MTEELLEPQKPTKRPAGLWVLLIITLIYSSVNAFTGLIKLLAGPSEKQLLLEKKYFLDFMTDFKKYDSEGVREVIEMRFVFMDAVYANFYTYYSLYFIFYSLGVSAAILMFKRLKVGFHVYIAYSLLLLTHNYFILSPSQLNISDLMVLSLLSVLMIFLYSRYLKEMK